MGQKKLERFSEINSFNNVLQHPANMPGNWHLFFKNDHSVTLELACGKGEYTVALAEKYPDQNFIGIDIKGNRIWRGAKTALESGLTNAAFLRIEIDAIDRYFSVAEVNEIWITFPDPQLRLSKIKKRLTHPKFLRLYRQILKPGGAMHLKTDSPALYHFTKAVIEMYDLSLITDYNDVYAVENLHTDLMIKTHYESLDIAQSNKIFYLKFLLDKELPAEKDAVLKDHFRE